MNTTTALATPIPPSSSAISATRPRYPVSRESVSLSCSLVVGHGPDPDPLGLAARGVVLLGDRLGGDAGRQLEKASYSARAPKPSSLVSSRYRAGMKIRGPNAARSPTLPGALTTVPLMTKRASPRASVSPTRALERGEQRGVHHHVAATAGVRHQAASGVGADLVRRKG